MMDPYPKPPEALIQAIAQDLRPVRPSAPPLRQALRIAPLVLLFSWLIFLAMGVRRDSGTLGPFLTWGASASQFLLAIALVWIAAHEATPAARLPRQIVRTVAVAAFLAVVTITLLTASLSPAGRPVRGSPWFAGFACGLGSTIAGGVLILVLGLIFRKSLAARPTVAGALYGAAAGVAINADWRLVCPVSTLPHALGAHGAAIIATMILGALLGRAWGYRRLQKSRRLS